MRMNNKSGFTLLEIIIVIIIVGVLASLALPRLFNTIAYSRSTEALNAMGIVKRAADRCAMAYEGATGTPGQYGQCDTWPELGIDDPGSAAGAYFTYTLDFSGAPNYVITATDGGGDTITYTYDTSAGAGATAITRVGGGVYSAIK